MFLNSSLKFHSLPAASASLPQLGMSLTSLCSSPMGPSL